jgi:hypothetical protein
MTSFAELAKCASRDHHLIRGHVETWECFITCRPRCTSYQFGRPARVSGAETRDWRPDVSLPGKLRKTRGIRLCAH